MFCYMKVMRSEECERIRENFERAFMSRGTPEGMLLARAKHREAGFLVPHGPWRNCGLLIAFRECAAIATLLDAVYGHKTQIRIVLKK